MHFFALKLLHVIFFFMSKLFYATLGFLAFIITFTACGKKDQCDQPAVTVANIQGKWKHRYPTNLEPGFTQPDYYHHIRFAQDSFFLEVEFITDIAIPNCSNIEYMKGVFKIEQAQLILTGIYTEADWSIKTGGCNKSGKFNRSFAISFCGEVLQLYRLNLPSASDKYKQVVLVKE